MEFTKTNKTYYYCILTVILISIINLILLKTLYSPFPSKTHFENPVVNSFEFTDGLSLLERRILVKKSFQFAFDNYKSCAYLKDEITPITCSYNNKWQGWGVTLIDALDTLFIMGLKTDFKDAVKAIEKVDFKKARSSVIFFETVIRHLGGLLSAYEQSNEKILLNKSIELVDKLIYAFDSLTDLPYRRVNFKTNLGLESSSNVAEVGSFFLEFYTLYKHTNNSLYLQKINKTIHFFKDYSEMNKSSYKEDGLFPNSVDVETGEMHGVSSFGANADSFYEYLLKMYILNSKENKEFLEMYKKSIDSMHKTLLYRSSKNKRLYISDNSDAKFGMMDHLACFTPGMLALGYTITKDEKDLQTAKDLMDTCYSMYNSTPSGLSPESIQFFKHEKEFNFIPKYASDISKEFYNKNGFMIETEIYLLRPETIESLFYLYRITKQEKYRVMAWNIYKNIEKGCKTKYGYAVYKDVMKKKSLNNLVDSTESFLFAETFKYLYLIFSPVDFYSLNEYVFSTEAHPFKI